MQKSKNNRCTNNDVAEALALLNRGTERDLDAADLRSIIKDMIALFPELGVAIRKTTVETLQDNLNAVVKLDAKLAEKGMTR